MAGATCCTACCSLPVSWAGVAAFFLWAGAEFVAFAQVLVYLGAISMVVLFAVLLTRRSREDVEPRDRTTPWPRFAVAAGAAVAAVLLCGGVAHAAGSGRTAPHPR